MTSCVDLDRTTVVNSCGPGFTTKDMVELLFGAFVVLLLVQRNSYLNNLHFTSPRSSPNSAYQSAEFTTYIRPLYVLPIR